MAIELFKKKQDTHETDSISFENYIDSSKWRIQAIIQTKKCHINCHTHLSTGGKNG